MPVLTPHRETSPAARAAAPPAPGSPLRTLHVETGTEAGGSGMSLFQLVQALDPTQVRPQVLFFHDQAHVARFRAAGLDVQVLPRGSRPRRVLRAIALRARTLPRPRRRLLTPLVRAAHYAGALLDLVVDQLPRTLWLARHLRRVRYDVVHLNDQLRAHRDALVACRLTGTRVLCHERMVGRLNALDRWLARGVTLHVCNADWVRAALIDQGLADHKLRRVWNGVVLPPPPARTRAQETDRLRVAFVGRFERWKGHELLLDAFARLCERGVDATLAIAGEATAAQRPYAAALERRVVELGLAQRVTFVGFQDVPTFLAGRNVLVHCSITPEPFGRVLVEAMACGVCVVSTREGGGAEIVRDGRDGVLVAPRDPAALADALLALAQDPARRRTLAAAGRRRVEESFSIEAHARAVEALYREIAG